MKRTIAIIMLFLGVLQLWGCAAHKGADQQVEPIAWRTLPEGKAEALESNMPVLVDFYYGPECHRCKVLDQQVYNDPGSISRIKRDFVPVRVDLTKELSAEEKELSNVLESGDECILVFLNAKGNIIKDDSGKRLCTMDMLNREGFMEYLDRALDRINR